ncbi:MAG: glycerophosphoryl diester phosphodiesterase [Planctomycetota bacterium]|jgi:glycerophosphoryl diester phosphodiesterase
MPIWLEQFVQRIADLVFMLLPRSRPTRQALLDCKIVSHRGEHDNKRVLENTILAFDRVQEIGTWGIELDLRWTKDAQAVVHHDSNTRRVFKQDIEISQVTLVELQRRIADIPTLAQVIWRYGSRMHLMVELKRGDNLDPAQKMAHLQPLFAGLTPGVDFHFISLYSDLFELVKFAPQEALLPIAELNISSSSAQTLKSGLAGIGGQYLLLSNKMIRDHHRCNQKVGSGFSASRFCFYRELNRGVDWIFTNDAVRLQKIRQRLLRNS